MAAHYNISAIEHHEMKMLSRSWQEKCRFFGVTGGASSWAEAPLLTSTALLPTAFPCNSISPLQGEVFVVSKSSPFP